MNNPTPHPAPHPARALIARYRDIFAAAWARRDELAGPRRLTEETAFQPAALALADTPVHPAPRRAAWLLMSLFLLALLWSIWGQLDVVAVAEGRVIVSERTKTIQPLERSVVRHVLVRDGDSVHAGQPLVQLDPTDATADHARLRAEQQAAQAERLRAQSIGQALDRGAAQAWSAPMSLSIPAPAPAAGSATTADWTAAELHSLQQQTQVEWSDITARIARHAAEETRRQAEIGTARELLAKLEQTVPLARQREDDFRRLSEQGFVAGHAGQDRTRERIELERDLSTQRARVAEAQAALRETTHTRTAWLAETRRNLAERAAQATLREQQATQELAKAEQRQRLSTLTAPVAGTVQQLAVHTVGGVVTEAQVLMVIVPSAAQVSAEVILPNKDIGFIREGQRARIKLETFPFTRYGTIDATVVRVSPDAVADDKLGAHYPATLALDRTTIDVDGKTVRLGPGMNLTAEIMTGQRRVIEYLLSPIQRAASESLRER